MTVEEMLNALDSPTKELNKREETFLIHVTELLESGKRLSVKQVSTLKRLYWSKAC